MTQTNPWHPRIFVGAPTGSLNPQIPSPVYRPSPVAIEIADGIGFGIDGESLIVGDGVKNGLTTITGHLDDGTYPQRDFAVNHAGADTSIQSVYDWQNYAMHREGGKLAINGQDENYSSKVTESAGGLKVDGAFPAQRYDIAVAADRADVQGYDENASAQIIYTPDHISIKSSIPERCFEISRTDNGFHVQGAYRFQDFDVTYASDGFTIQGLYPQQKYVVAHP